MRMRHTLTTTIASLGLLASALAAPAVLAQASAAPAPLERVATASPTAEHARGTEKPIRNLHDSVVKKRGKLYLKGRVDPGHGPVFVQKKECFAKKCTWKPFKKVAYTTRF
jgi:hypothetical protein